MADAVSLHDVRTRLKNQGPRRFAATARLSDDGGEGNRTPDLLNAIQALSQLSYAPAVVTVDFAVITTTKSVFYDGVRQEPKNLSESNRWVK